MKKIKKIIQDENTPPSEREAAEERVAGRNEELDLLQTQIGERESAMPLRERVREIFKEHGVTVTAIFLAAGVAIGAVVGILTQALKASGKAMGNGLRDIGSKLGSILPEANRFYSQLPLQNCGAGNRLPRRAYLVLILAAVFFIFEKYIKKRR